MIRTVKEMKCWAREQRRELTGWTAKASERAGRYAET